MQLKDRASLSLLARKRQLISTFGRTAVTFPPGPLQILAGPGAGKTKVLTSRIAYLIKNHGVDPAGICAVTFSRKAATEMKERLVPLIGDATQKMTLGTFHSVALTLLRAHGSAIGLKDFTVIGANESKNIIHNILEPYRQIPGRLPSKPILREVNFLKTIFDAKAQGLTPLQFALQNTYYSSEKQLAIEVYHAYESKLRSTGALDFGDLLVQGGRLCASSPSAVEWCKHLVVDEFQDTNILQLQLMKELAGAHQYVTVVGDPDQSIYGWRCADPANFSLIKKDYEALKVLELSENFRCSGAILAASMAIISKDRKRAPKTVTTQNSLGLVPIIRRMRDRRDEAAGIATEIVRVRAKMDGAFAWSDFVVLIRMHIQSPYIERAFRLARIPYTTNGQSFFDRPEIRDLLSFFESLDDPDNSAAFTRAALIANPDINLQSIQEIIEIGQKHPLCPLEVCQQIYDGTLPNTETPVRRSLRPLLSTMTSIYESAAQGATPWELIWKLVESVDYKKHLQERHGDHNHEKKWASVLRLLEFSRDVEIREKRVDSDVPLLRRFIELAASNVSMEAHSDAVAISTVHSAKGLEWPVVFVAGVECGIYPTHHQDTAEDRRLLYVACTRAQSLLYLYYTTVPGRNHKGPDPKLSTFVSVFKNTHNVRRETYKLFTGTLPVFTEPMKQELITILKRTPPDPPQELQPAPVPIALNPTLLTAPAPDPFSAAEPEPILIARAIKPRPFMLPKHLPLDLATPHLLM